MNKFIDFHTHLDCYKNQQELLFQLQNFDGTIVSASMDLSSFIKTKELAQKSKGLGYSVNIIPTLGVHPAEVSDEIKKLKDYEPFFKDSPIIGEIGMDFCWYKNSSLKDQETVFRFFLEHCDIQKKYCVIHTKDAEEKICRILEEYKNARPIIHWYDGPQEIYQEFIHRSYMQTFGCQTIRSKHIQKLLQQTPLNLILAETDNPDSEKWLGGQDDTIFLIKRIYKDIAKGQTRPEPEIQKLINKNADRVIFKRDILL